MKPATTKMSSRGQVVIPEEIRDQLGLVPGTRFVVMGEGDVVILKTLKMPTMEEFDELIEEIQRQVDKAGITPEDVKRVIREVRRKK